MVANNFFGRSNKTETTSIRLSAASSSISNLVSEKIATSAPEIKAEQNNKIKSNKKLNMVEILIADKKISCKLLSSGSNVMVFSV